MKKISLPQDSEQLIQLPAGKEFLLSGEIFTARDQAHKRLIRLINQNKKTPFDLRGKVIYYCGPTLARPGKTNRQVIGSCGPTTSSRMDNFSGQLLAQGILAMIGKGRRSRGIRELIKKYKSVYCLAPAGCGALIAEKVISKELVCFADLGPEAIYRLEVKDLPLIVAIDSLGHSIYEDL